MFPTECARLGSLCLPLAVLLHGDLLHPEQQGPEHTLGFPERIEADRQSRTCPTGRRRLDNGHNQGRCRNLFRPLVHTGC